MKCRSPAVTVKPCPGGATAARACSRALAQRDEERAEQDCQQQQQCGGRSEPAAPVERAGDSRERSPRRGTEPSAARVSLHIGGSHGGSSAYRASVNTAELAGVLPIPPHGRPGESPRATWWLCACAGCCSAPASQSPVGADRGTTARARSRCGGPRGGPAGNAGPPGVSGPSLRRPDTSLGSRWATARVTRLVWRGAPSGPGVVREPLGPDGVSRGCPRPIRSHGVSRLLPRRHDGRPVRRRAGAGRVVGHHLEAVVRLPAG